MTYLNRPVFTFPINWDAPVNKSFAYDLKEHAIGFGPEFFASLQVNVIQGFSFELWFTCDADIASYDAFTASLNGRLAGFWLPAPIEGMELASVTAQNMISIVAQGLSATWQDQPDTYLYITAPGQAAACCQIHSVTANGATEQVKLDTFIPWLQSVAVNTISVFRLHYVRLASDSEQGKFIGENSMKRTVKVVELPEEYTNIETGLQKIFLYTVIAPAPINYQWCFTNFAGGVQSLGTSYGFFPMLHKTLQRSKTLAGETLEIEAKYGPNHPFSLFLPIPLPRPVWVKIVETTLADVDTQYTVFYGRIVSVSDKGETISANCESIEYILNYKTPGPLVGSYPDQADGAFCPWCVYDTNTCRVPRGFYEITATITAINSAALPPTVTVQFAAGYQALPNYGRWQQANWFAQGWIEIGQAAEFELRVVQSSTWNAANSTLTLALHVELVNAVVGQSIQLVPGCDGKGTTCRTKFSNYANFGGFPGVPVVQPNLTSFYNSVMQGGKNK